MARRRTLQLIFVCSVSLVASAQVPTIINEIGELESVRDPKCYATASRLEDFIYGTPLESEARFAKIELQKQYIRAVWEKASSAARAAGKSEVGVDELKPVLQATVPYAMNADGSWTVRGDVQITARDKRQYGTVAYALRAVLAVQQESLGDARLLPLTADAVELFKESVDLVTLAALQRADRASRTLNRERLGADVLKSAWKTVVGAAGFSPPISREAVGGLKPAAPPQGEKFATIKAIVAEKLGAFEKYNNLSMAVFLRNLQVYMARHMWPSDPEEGKAFRDQFTNVMINWMNDVLLAADKEAKKNGHPLIRVGDVHAALQLFQPHEANQYEDIIYFPRLPKEERVVIEAYDLDSFRDPGIHWLYLSQAINDPNYKGTIEPDPFAAELLTEGAAQEGVLILRIAGQIAEKEERERLQLSDLEKSIKTIQAKLDKHASMPAPKKTPAAIASAPAAKSGKGGKYFTDVTSSSGIAFEHRMSDWLARFIRGYQVVEGNAVRLAVPPTFGGAGVAAEDIDNDGDADVLILSGAGNALYLNDGKGRFTDAT
ncbi:MAG TPA: VCBS repeat-containing protein, partial [Thermoanaerobaculia bacterium]|nr:VCBS repeat-containing protein [Thermoanaerobaculia bacterium]